MSDDAARAWVSIDGKTTVYVGRVEVGTIRAGDLVSFDASGTVVKAQPGQPIIGTFTAPLTEADFSAWFDASREADRVRRENAEARERWRERVLLSLDWHHERPCASCGLVHGVFVCHLCDVGLPCPGGGWRLRPEAAERIRAKAKARRYDEPLPLP
jgi:hypothetical protein